MRRISGNSSKIASLTLAQIQSIAPVMTIDQLFHIAINAKKALFLETKHPVPTRGAVERELMAYLNSYKSLIEKSRIEIKLMSFSKMAVRRFSRQSICQPMQLIKDFRTLRTAKTKDVGIGIFLLRNRSELIAQAKAQGKRVHIWTVDDPEEALWLANLGVDSITTNKPALIRQALN